MTTFDGTPGDDVFPVTDAVDGDVIEGGEGIDTLDLSGIVLHSGERILVDLDINNQGALNGNPPSTQHGVLRIFDADGALVREVLVNDVENIIGSDTGDTLFGNNESNVIEGNGGDDVIHGFGAADTIDGGEGSDTVLLNAANGSVTIDLVNQTVGPNTLISIENADGGGFDDTIIGNDEANILEGNGGVDQITTGGGTDTLRFGGTALGSGPDQISDFSIAEDLYELNAGDFGVTGDLSFVNALAEDLPDAGANVIVLQDSDDDGDAGTVFNARSAARLIGEQVSDAGAGFFVYFNSALNVNRLVFSQDLSDGDAGLTILAAQTDVTGQDAIDALPTFTTANFDLVNIDTSGDDTVFVTDVIDGEVLDGGEGVDTLDLSNIVLNDGERIVVDLDAVNQGALNGNPPSSQDGEVRVIDANGVQVRTLSVTDFENIVGSDASETLFGNNESNVIEGNGGDDVIHGFGAADTIDGGEGSDTVLLNAANGPVTIDLLNQVVGPNTLISIENAEGGGFADTIIGSDEANVLVGNGGDDTIDGRGGDDSFIVDNGDGSDDLIGGSGTDTATVNLDDAGEDVARIEARGNEFRVVGQSGNTFVTTLSGIEILNLNGLGGDDRLSVSNNVNQGIEIVVDGGAGNDELQAGNGDVTLRGGTGDDTLNGSNGDDTLEGGDDNDRLTGSNGQDDLFGGAGDDTLSGGNNNDRADGGAGNDEITGGNGFDTLAGGDGDDTVDGGNGFDDLSGGAGNDILEGGNGFDTLDGGDGDDVLDGGNGFDLLTGGAGNDVLEGGNGFDTLNGGAGDDTLTGGNGRDSFVFDGDPFDGADVSAPGRQVVNTPDVITDFRIQDDQFQISAADFGIDGFSFVSGVSGEIDRNATVVVLEDGFANAGAAAAAIAANDAITADEGLFVYFNTNLGINRLVYSNDLSDNGDISILANLTGETGQSALDSLDDFSAQNFDFI